MAPAALRAFASSGRLTRTLVAYGLFSLVELSAWLAVVLFAYDEGGAGLASIAAVAQLVPAALLSPAITGLGERLPRGTALAAAHAGVAGTAALTAVVAGLDLPVALVIAAAALLTTALAVVRPLHFAALPQLATRPNDLVSANALSSVADGVAVFAGPVLAGVAAGVAGPWLVLAANAAAALIATGLTLRLRLARASTQEADDEGWRATFAGLAVLRSDRAAFSLMLVLTMSFVIAGALDVLGVAFAEIVLGQDESVAGLVVGAVGIGGLAGALVAAWVARRRALTVIIIVAGSLQGLAVAAVAAVDLLAPTMTALAIAGIGEAVLLVAGRTLLQRTVADHVLARVFAVQESMSLLGLAVGAALAPLLIALMSAGGAFAPLGLGAAILTLAGTVLIRQLDVRSIYLPDEIALLRRVSFLAVLPPFELERLSRAARWIDVQAGNAVVRQGEPGDTFFIIGSGEFLVTVDERARPDLLTRGTSFGEISLLRSVARTATVRAASNGRLLAISSADFLAAVTGSSDGHVLAREVAQAHLARDRARNPSGGR